MCDIIALKKNLPFVAICLNVRIQHGSERVWIHYVPVVLSAREQLVFQGISCARQLSSVLCEFLLSVGQLPSVEH